LMKIDKNVIIDIEMLLRINQNKCYR